LKGGDGWRNRQVHTNPRGTNWKKITLLRDRSRPKKNKFSAKSNPRSHCSLSVFDVNFVSMTKTVSVPPDQYGRLVMVAPFLIYGPVTPKKIRNLGEACLTVGV